LAPRWVSAADFPEQDTRFALFAASWALVVLFGMSSEQMVQTPLQIAVCVAAGVVLLVPRQPVALGVAALAFVVHFWVDEYRMLFVHTAFVFAGCAGVLLALVPTFHRDAAAWRRRFVDAYAPVAVAQTAICFFAAGFAKLNTDYLAVETSCGAVFYAHQITAFPYSLLPAAPWAERGALYMALILEIATPLLWLHHRTRKVGFWAGGFLLFLLGTNARARYYVFTGPFLALLLLGFDWEPVRRWVAERVPPRVLEGARVVRWITVVVLLGGALLVGDDEPAGRWFVCRLLFVVWALAVFAAVAVAPSVRMAARPVVPGIARIAWIVALLYALHEALPYVGLKAQRNFTMAGNLVLNAEWSNHLLFERAPALPFSRVAVLESSSDRALDRRGKTIWQTWVLYDYLARHPDVRATFTVDGERVTVRGADVADRKSLLAPLLHVIPSSRTPRAQPCGHGRPKR
jgi:hypothetical protein